MHEIEMPTIEEIMLFVWFNNPSCLGIHSWKLILDSYYKVNLDLLGLEVKTGFR